MNDYPLTVLIDGACPLCWREAELWRRLDRGRGTIVLLDINSADFDAARCRVTREQALKHIHGILPSGDIVRGMEVIRRAYKAVGCGWLLAPTGWPLLRPLFDRAYEWFARNRLRLTRRQRPGGESCLSRRQGSALKRVS